MLITFFRMPQHQFILLLNILVLVSMVSGVQDSISEQVFQQFPSYMNAFSYCTIRLINFPGYNIDSTKLHEPILILRYFSFNDTTTVYPMEINHFNDTEIIRYYSQDRHILYESSFYSYKLKNSHKSSNCDAEVMIEPPDWNIQSSLYNFHYHWMFKHPYLNSYFDTYQESNWKLNHVDTRSIYSVLVTINQMQNNNCISSICYTWLRTAWMFVQYTKIHHQLFIWEISNQIKILAYCKFCDHCSPDKFVSLTGSDQLSPETTWLVRLTALVSTRSKQYTIDVVLSGLVSDTYFSQNRDYSMKSTIKLMNLNDLTHYGIRPIVIHPLTISAIVPNNVSLQFSRSYDEEEFSDKLLLLPGCPENESVNYAPHLRLAIKRNTFVNMADFADPGLIIDNTQLLFVVCHGVTFSWLSRLKELISPFDFKTWLIGFISLVSMSILINLQPRKSFSFPFGTACEALVALLLEKGHLVFHWSSIKTKTLRYFVVFGVPFVLLVLSNEYRGDNISKLTVEPDFYPFDRFNDLVRHKFSVYTFPMELMGYEYDSVLQSMSINVTNELDRGSSHEFFPFVTIFWYEIMLRFNPWTTIKTYYDRLENRTLFYLNHSKIYGQDKILSLDREGATRFVEDVWENWQDHAWRHLRQCNHSAMIMHQNKALIVFTKLKNLKAPAFLGKDVIHEIINGYSLYGQMPAIIYWRAKYFFNSGILNFWRTYYDYVLILRARSSKMIGDEKTYGNRRKSNSAVYTILFIPVFGFSASFVVLLHEKKNIFTKNILLLVYCIKLGIRCIQETLRSKNSKITIIIVKPLSP